jgi:hypothetical protein
MLHKIPKECILRIILYSGFLSMKHLSETNRTLNKSIEWIFNIKIRACPESFFNDKSKQTMRFVAKISDSFEFNNFDLS